MGLFDAPTGAAPGAGTSLTSGSPDYQSAIVGNTMRQLQPAYAQALQGSDQSMSNRGLLDSGLGAQAQLGLQQSYLGQLGNVATNAATQGADLAEQNRQREEQRGWQVQDRDLNMQYLKDQANQQQQNLGNQQWSQLIGQGLGAVGGVAGSMYGGPVGGALGSQAGQGLGALIAGDGSQGGASNNGIYGIAGTGAGGQNPLNQYGYSSNPNNFSSQNPNDPYGMASK